MLSHFITTNVLSIVLLRLQRYIKIINGGKIIKTNNVNQYTKYLYKSIDN